MDKLEKIFEMQKLLDDDIAARRNLDFTTEEWMQKEVLAMLSELSEVLDEVNFKWWKNKKIEIEIYEVIDYANTQLYEDRLWQKNKPILGRESKKEYNQRLSDIRSAKGTPTVIIKVADNANYDNLMKVLDEMLICNIGKYVIDNFTDADKALLESKGVKFPQQ